MKERLVASTVQQTVYAQLSVANSSILHALRLALKDGRNLSHVQVLINDVADLDRAKYEKLRT